MQNIGLFRNEWWNESKVTVDDTFVLSALWDRTRNVLDFKEKALEKHEESREETWPKCIIKKYG